MAFVSPEVEQAQRRRQMVEALWANQMGRSQARNPLSAVADAASQIALAYATRKAGDRATETRDRADAQRRQGLLDTVTALSSRGQSVPRPQVPSGPDDRTMEANGGDLYLAQLANRESGGNYTAENPNSTAFGKYQITAPTWAGIARNNPDAGLPADPRMATPEQQEIANSLLRRESRGVLDRGGFTATPANEYAMHMLGASDGTRFLDTLQRTPGMAVTEILSKQALEANPDVFFRPDGSPKSVADVYLNFSRSFGGPATSGPQPESVRALQQGSPVADAMASRQPPPVPENLPNGRVQLINALLSNPQTADVGEAALTQMIAAQFESPDFDIVGDAVGGFFRVNPRTGEMSPVVPGRGFEWQQPGYIDARKEIAEAGRAQTTINNAPGGNELSKLDAATVSGMGEGVRKLREIMPDMARVSQALKKFATGPTANVRLYLGQFARDLGLNVGPDVAEGEIIQAIQSRLAPAMRATGSGASSDRDVTMFLNSLPNLMRSPEGNRLVIENMQRILERKQAEEAFMRQWFREHGNSLDGVYQAMDSELPPLELAGLGQQPAATAPTDIPAPPDGFSVVQ